MKCQYIFYFLITIQRPLLLEPSLSRICISCNSLISFCTCFLVKSNFSMILVCVMFGSISINFKISFFLISPFIGSFSAPLFLSFVFSQIQAINESCQDYNFLPPQALANLHSPKLDKYLEYHCQLFHQYQSY